MTAGAIGPKIVLTGPTGWIGSAMLANIARRIGPGWTDMVTLFGSSERPVTTLDGTTLPMRALADMRAEDVDGAIVVHLAYLTKEKVETLGERIFTDTNLAIDDQLLSALATGRPAMVFVASSGAAALAEKGVDRHPYGLTKLRQEDRFLGWSAATGVPVLAGRIFNLSGPYINKVESYAIGSFTSQARRGGRISIEARVPVFRSFLHVDDLCSLILGAGAKSLGRPTATDLCGAEILEMADIAARVAAYVGNGATIERGAVDHGRSSVYLGDFTHTRILALELGVTLAPFSQQVADTVAWIDAVRLIER